jgi:hypothetical protein
MMKRVLSGVAMAEMGTGLALVAVPSLVAQLLLGEPLADVGITVARVAGLALIGLGLACWPGPALLGMVTYSAMTALYLAALGVSGGASGPLLWPAVLLHLGIAGVLGRGFARAGN